MISGRALREREILGGLLAAGIPLVVGTESCFGCPSTCGFGVHDELVEVVGIGLTPAEALRAGTLHPARCRWPTRSAPYDNPLEDIRSTTRIHAVVLNGRLLDRGALDALLVEFGRNRRHRARNGCLLRGKPHAG